MSREVVEAAIGTFLLLIFVIMAIFLFFFLTLKTLDNSDDLKAYGDMLLYIFLVIFAANGPVKYLIVPSFIAYIVRWIHFKIEKDLHGDTDIRGGYASLLTMFNLEGKAQLDRGGVLLEMKGMNFEEMKEATEPTDEEENPEPARAETTIGGAAAAVVVSVAVGGIGAVDVTNKEEESELQVEMKKSLSTSAFGRYYWKISSIIFTPLQSDEDKENDESDKEVDALPRDILADLLASEEKGRETWKMIWNFITATILIVKSVATAVVVTIGSMSDILVVVYWLAIVLGGFVRAISSGFDFTTSVTWIYGDSDLLDFHALFFLIGLSTMLSLGYNVAVLTSLMNYYDLLKRGYKRIKNRFVYDDSWSSSSSEDGVDHSKKLSRIERVVIGLLTMGLIPVFILGRALNFDVISKSILYIAWRIRSGGREKPRGRLANQQLFFWNIGKSLPMLYMQVISASFSFYYAIRFLLGKEKSVVEAVLFLVPAVIGAASSTVAFTSAVVNTFTWNANHYSRGPWIWKLNFILHQATCLLMRLVAVFSSVLVCCLILEMTDKYGERQLFIFIIYLSLSNYIVFFLFSFVTRISMLYTFEVFHSLRKVRFRYILLHSAQFDVVLDSFAGSFGGVINAIPTLSFIVQVFTSSSEATLFSVMNALFQGAYTPRFSESSSESSVVETETTMLYLVNYICNIALGVHAVSIYIYLATAFLHIFLFPIYRKKPMSFQA